MFHEFGEILEQNLIESEEDYLLPSGQHGQSLQSVSYILNLNILIA